MRRGSDRNDGVTTCGGDMSLVNSGDQLSAFPWVCEDQKIVAKGMTMRDYFAAKAMQGLIHHFDFGTFRDDPLRVARWAYDAADAMMEARKR